MQSPDPTKRHRKSYFYGISSYKGFDPLDKRGIIGALLMAAAILIAVLFGAV